VARAAGADHVVRLGPRVAPPFLPLPGQGPVLTWRGLQPGAVGAERHDWALELGDVELF
jgi:hypothetical protein